MARVARNRLRERRAGLGLTQHEVAERIGVSQQTIARWEGGAEIPSRYLKDIAILLDCRVDELIRAEAQGADVLGARRAERERAEFAVPYGTARLVWVGSDVDPMEEADEWLPTQYPISEGEMRRLYSRLQRRDEHATWFIFETLDSRLVMVNRHQLELFSMVSDDAEQMPPFEHEEIYKALADHRLRDALPGNAPARQVGEVESRYSEALLRRCAEVVDEWGGFERVEDRMLAITFETVGGHRTSIWADPRGFEEVAELAFEIDGVDDRDNAPMSEWMVDLFSEGYERSSLYRLGSLRLIEVPLLQYAEANDRLFAG